MFSQRDHFAAKSAKSGIAHRSLKSKNKRKRLVKRDQRLTEFETLKRKQTDKQLKQQCLKSGDPCVIRVNDPNQVIFGFELRQTSSIPGRAETGWLGLSIFGTSWSGEKPARSLTWHPRTGLYHRPLYGYLLTALWPHTSLPLPLCLSVAPRCGGFRRRPFFPPLCRFLIPLRC